MQGFDFSQVAIEVGILAAIGLPVARWFWVQFRKRFERDEAEIKELRKELKQCMTRESRCQQQLARMEVSLENVTREVERLRVVVEERT